MSLARINCFFEKLVFMNRTLSITTAILLILGTFSGSGCQLGRSFRPITARVVENREVRREGISAMEQGNWAEAEKKLAKAVEKNERSEDMPDIRRYYAEALWQQGKRDEAFNQLYLALKYAKNDAGLNKSLAEKLLEANQLDDAFQTAGKLTLIAPSDHISWALRAKAYRRFGDLRLEQGYHDIASRLYRKSLSDYHKALSLCEMDTEANRKILPELAELQRIMGQPERELATWQSLQKYYPPNQEPLEVFSRKIELYISMDRYEDAEEAYMEARKSEAYDHKTAHKLSNAESLLNSRLR